MSTDPVPHDYVAKDIIESIRPLIKSSQQQKIEEVCHQLHVTNNEAYVVERRIRMAIEQGLSKEKHKYSSVKCFPTYVRHLPTGEEKGKFLALDLGGTNFRVLLVELFGSDEEARKPNIHCRKFPVPKALMMGSGRDLFDYIAGCISNFVRDLGLQSETLPIGFTFSFPCQQTRLDRGYLMQWTKGFHCDDVVGGDVCGLLMEAIERRGDVKVHFTALLNDTTGCLISCAWVDPRCRIGLIVGTGCNACYLEDLPKVENWDGSTSGPQTVVVNTEWGAFGEHGELDFILTKWDRLVDENSINPGKQVYEKMISGMYMGEIVRYILAELAEKKLVFQDLDADDLERLRQTGTFTAKHCCEVEHDPIGDFDRGRRALKEVLGQDDRDISDADCYTVRYVCEEVSRRASMLLGAGIAGLLKKMKNYKDVVVAVDGTLFRCHPLFYNITKKKITQLMGVEYKFDLRLSDDGSGLGAAVIAAVVTREKNRECSVCEESKCDEQSEDTA